MRSAIIAVRQNFDFDTMQKVALGEELDSLGVVKYRGVILLPVKGSKKSTRELAVEYCATREVEDFYRRQGTRTGLWKVTSVTMDPGVTPVRRIVKLMWHGVADAKDDDKKPTAKFPQFKIGTSAEPDLVLMAIDSNEEVYRHSHGGPVRRQKTPRHHRVRQSMAA